MNKKLVSALLVSCLLVVSHTALAGWEDMTAEDITAAFSGKTAWGNHAIKDKRNMVYFAADGSWKSKRLNEKGGSEGKWSVDGSNLCMEKEGDTRCRRCAQKKKDGKIRKYKGKKHVWTYTKFEDGNKL